MRKKEKARIKKIRKKNKKKTMADIGGRRLVALRGAEAEVEAAGAGAKRGRGTAQCRQLETHYAYIADGGQT